MWLFTNRGFYSVVQDPSVPEMFQVRARRKADLEALDSLIPGLEIVELPHRDYPCRIYVEREVWEGVVVELTRDIDYGNFKDSVTAKLGHPYHDVLLRIWGVALGLSKLRKRQAGSYSLAATREREFADRVLSPHDADPRGPHEQGCVLSWHHTGPCERAAKRRTKKAKR